MSDGSHCERCGKFLYFSQRQARLRWCGLCAAQLGVFQIGDRANANVAARALALESWWRWTVWLGRALQLITPPEPWEMRR
jgi:hypothetical protein